jgi:hypothetical protein
MKSDNRAYEYGKKACKAGKPCVPAWDIEFLEAMIRGAEHNDIMNHLSNWQNGWIKESLRRELN